MKKLILASVFAAIGAFNAHAADFGGAYVGGDVSYSRSKIDGGDDAKGVSGGLNAGYGVLYGQWYIGGEIGGGFSGVEGDAASGSVQKKDYYTGVARLGYKAMDGVLAYGLVGLEGGSFDSSGKTRSDWGMRYGLGVETFVKDNISIKGQVDYVDWQGKHGNPGQGEWRVGTGVNYHF
jgi:opacity protein-like surface antigen